MILYLYGIKRYIIIFCEDVIQNKGDTMQEEWRAIKGWEDYYEVSNMGRVRSVGRVVKRGNDAYSVKSRIIKIGMKNTICLCKDGKPEYHLIHRLVAEAFIPNPENLPIINHKDENPLNNRADNLEWCTYSYNNSYNDLRIRAAEKFRKPVLQYSKDGKFIREWSHAREAADTLGLSKRAIYECCAGRSKSSGGYIWKRK